MSNEGSAPTTAHSMRPGGNMAGDRDNELRGACSMNFFTLVVYKAKHHGRSPIATLWISAGLSLALLEVSVIYGLVLNYLAPTCFTNDDCNIGTVCTGTVDHEYRPSCVE
jgi:hypothetical protein